LKNKKAVTICMPEFRTKKSEILTKIFTIQFYMLHRWHWNIKY